MVPVTLFKNDCQPIDPDSPFMNPLPIITGQILAFSYRPPEEGGGHPRVLAVTRGAAPRFQGREVFLRAMAHKKHHSLLQSMLAGPCYVTVLTSVLNHERALSAQGRLFQNRLCPQLLQTIVSPASASTTTNQLPVPPMPVAIEEGLDQSQYQACMAIIGSRQPIELLWGPPGTG